MSDLRQAAAAALEALEGVLDTYGEPLDKLSIAGGTYEALYCRDAITALRAALAEPEPQEIADLRQACQEGWRYADELDQERKRLQDLHKQPLTDEEIKNAINTFKVAENLMGMNHVHVARAIERAHGIGGEA